MKTVLTILFFYWVTCIGIAQNNTLVMGKITNNNARITAIDLQVNHRYLDGNIDTYESNILEDGSFAFAVRIEEPQLVNLLYARNNAQLYLEPNDTLYVDFDANSFKFSFDFSGRSGENNAYLNRHLQNHPRELDPFKYLQYRSGSYWYKIEPDKDYAMRSMTKDQFTQKIHREREEALTNLIFFSQNNKQTLTHDFIEFLEAEIYYDWVYHTMLFGDVYKGTHGLDESFFTFLEEVPLQHPQIGSHWYRMFLLAYLNKQYRNQRDQHENPYVGQYEIARQVLSSKSMFFAQSEMVNIGFYKKYIDATLPIYNDFIDKNPYPQFDDKAIFAYQKAIKTAIGTAAPDFALDGGQTNSRLSHHKGKIVLLNFWATWCRPCIKKMKELQSLQNRLSEDFVFIHVGFDKNEAKWNAYIEAKGWKGLHLLAPAGIHSDIAKKYDIKALPQYFILDKNGTFAEKPAIFSIENLEVELNYLNRSK